MVDLWGGGGGLGIRVLPKHFIITKSFFVLLPVESEEHIKFSKNFYQWRGRLLQKPLQCSIRIYCLHPPPNGFSGYVVANLKAVKYTQSQ